jgi:hypothetical protein
MTVHWIEGVANHSVDIGARRRVAQTINDVVEEACIRFRFPRPALTVSPRPSTLLPAA